MNVGWKYNGPRRLMTFALDAKAVLPPSPPRSRELHPLDDPSLELNPGDVGAGHDLFARCGFCHGAELISPGFAPDLRESQIALDSEGFWLVLHDGILMQNGMPKYDGLSRTEVDQLRAYIRSGARDAMGARNALH
jgi:quinohemoprotein ethanol dehydrogenase